MAGVSVPCSRSVAWGVPGHHPDDRIYHRYPLATHLCFGDRVMTRPAATGVCFATMSIVRSRSTALLVAAQWGRGMGVTH